MSTDEKKETLEADSVTEDGVEVMISQKEIERSNEISAHADELRNHRLSAPPLVVSPQGANAVSLVSFFKYAPIRGSRIGIAARTFELSRKQLRICNSAIEKLRELSPYWRRIAYDRYDEALVEICAIFASLTPEDLANLGSLKGPITGKADTKDTTIDASIDKSEGE